MAPKNKHEPPPPPPEDTNPFGVFVTITIPSATVVLDLPPDAPQDPAAQRKTHITLNLPGCHVPWASPPTAPSEGGVYQYSVDKHFRRSGGQDGLLQLINGTVTVTVNDSATNAVLASTTLDQMWGFAIGQNTWSADGQDLTPAAAVPAGVPKALSARLSFISIELHERPLPPGADPAALAAAPPPEAELPPLLPYSYVSPEFAESGNMVELVVTDISPLPPQLLTASDLSGGKVAVSAGIKLPGGGPTVVVTLQLAGGRLVAPALRREQLSSEAATELQFYLEDGLPLQLEVARYVTAEHFNDPAWEAYHAVAAASPSFRCLLSAGATSGVAEGLPLTSFAAFAAAAGEGTKSCMPPYTPPPGKSKPIEESPAGGVCPWEKVGARLNVSFRLARPIIPPWQPPPPPPRSLLEMIPPRDLTPKPPPTTAADEFKAKVRVVARALAEEYKALLPPPGPSLDGSGDGEAAAGGGGGGGGGGAEARHKALVFELNRSGKYAQMRDSLKASVVSLVREKYRKSGSMSPNEMALLYNDLYGTLLGAMHAALNDMIDGAAARPRDPLPEPVPDKQRLGQLLELAGQSEALGDTNRAEALHQRRLLAKNDAQVWYEYGTFCLRRGAASRGRAEQAFREALSLEPTHRPALLALLGCSVAEGRATDPAYLEAAEAAAHRLMQVSAEAAVATEAAAAEGKAEAAEGAGQQPQQQPQSQSQSQPQQQPVAVTPGGALELLEQWAVMALVYKAYGDSKRSELASCEQEMSRLEKEATAASADPGTEAPTAGEGAALPVLGELQARAFISLATSLLKTLSLPSEALLALDLATGLRHWPSVDDETRREHLLVSALAEAAAAAAAGGSAGGVGEALLAPGGPLIGLMRRGGRIGWRTKLLTAQLYREVGAVDEAIRYYQEYLDEARQADLVSEVELPVWLQLAGCYAGRGQHRYAADVYLLGAAAAPGCAALWRGAGQSYAEEGDLASADMCLSEANVLDPEDPGAWGWLALVALRDGRGRDAEAALGFGLRCGLDEPRVLLALAEEYRTAGQLRQEQRVLQELAVRLMPESCSMRLLLARCLVAQHCGPEAAEQLAAARELAAGEDDLAQVEQLEGQLRGMA
ncbi:hypothetical protein PLESTF_000531100 [Pleodorina starrii]|nr:hypothetical protein PLESTF_000531100 [Pleodorina starrii]